MPLTGDPWLPYRSDGSVPAVRLGAPVGVFKYDGVSSFQPLPNVECLSTAHGEGTDPGTAEFRYNLASGLTGAPASIEQALGTDFSSPLIINPGDRLVVQAVRPDGSVECLFDGEPVGFGMGLDPETEEVNILALGIGWREWDDVIPGAIMRNAGPMAATVSDVETDVPAQFNPKGLPNCTPDNAMSGFSGAGGDSRYPVFLDPLVIGTPDQRTYWTLAKACRYVMFRMNPDQSFVKNPDGAYLDALLVSSAAAGDISLPIRCPDTPITGKDWPGTVNRLVSECGFGTGFQLDTVGGLPVTSFRVFANQGGAVKQLYLYPRGTTFDPTLFNVGSSGIHRDVAEVVNQVTVVGGLDRWEGSFVLAPGFPMTGTDASAGTLPTFDTGNPAYLTTNRSKYRLFVFDECNEGHYLNGTNGPVNSNNSLDGLFGAPIMGQRQYAQRRREPIGTLISRDPQTMRPFEARISVSTDYAGPYPGLWDGTGTWQVVATTTWRLLDDRLGVEITDSNPNKWDIGESSVSGAPFPRGVVRAIEALNTSTTFVPFFVRLTCVVESDQALAQVAMPTGNSPLPQAINRIVDASDRFHNEFVDAPSEFNATGAAPLNPRNDKPAALAEAQAIRANSESGVLEGPVVIPRLTTYYRVGDRISQIEGRNLGLRTDGGTDQPVYPVVVGVRHDFGPESQTTTLELSDAGTKRTRYKRPPGRRMMATGGTARGPSQMMAGGYGGLGGPPPAKPYTTNNYTHPAGERGFVERQTQTTPGKYGMFDAPAFSGDNWNYIGGGSPL